jgi:hypothetical protein
LPLAVIKMQMSLLIYKRESLIANNNNNPRFIGLTPAAIHANKTKLAELKFPIDFHVLNFS